VRLQERPKAKEEMGKIFAELFLDGIINWERIADVRIFNTVYSQLDFCHFLSLGTCFLRSQTDASGDKIFQSKLHTFFALADNTHKRWIRDSSETPNICYLYILAYKSSYN